MPQETSNDPEAVFREIEAEIIRQVFAATQVDTVIFRALITGLFVGAFTAAAIIVPIMVLI